MSLYQNAVQLNCTSDKLTLLHLVDSIFEDISADWSQIQKAIFFSQQKELKSNYYDPTKLKLTSFTAKYNGWAG